MGALILNLCSSWRRMMLLYVMGVLAVMVLLYQFWVFPSRSYFTGLSIGEERGVSLVTVRDAKHSEYSSMNNVSVFDLVRGVHNTASEIEVEGKNEGVTYVSERREDDVVFGKGLSSIRKFSSMENKVEQLYMLDKSNSQDNSHKTANANLAISRNFSAVLGEISLENGALGDKSNISASIESSQLDGLEHIVQLEAGSADGGMESSVRNDTLKIERYVRKMRGVTITLSEMKSTLLNAHPASLTSVIRLRRWSTARDRELLSARKKIENAPILRNFADLHAPLFRNASVFKRSYDLMDGLLKIYVYKEGEKPIFHQPALRGLYSAEGWFMKLIERSKRFTVRDPKKAHLYYLPFSSEKLRMTLHEEKFHSIKDLEHYLTGYVDLIRKQHRFWNRTGGADHFLVACHDWAPHITRQHLSNSIRALCNANAARGFSIGNDVSVPVTYIRSGNDPTRGMGGKPPSERNILAFFAGHMHGYLRPLLLQHWENKVPDMKVFGPVFRGIEGKVVYSEFMKSSKYCICARGYGVHTPRVVESIFYECVPVIIADNYVPPFFEVLDWEAFAVIVQEKDIPNLRNILVSIPEERYLEMQLRVKMVQQHFVWHKIPEKYDLFHMILHSIWYNRVSQIKPK